jgi:hypothetical protein
MGDTCIPFHLLHIFYVHSIASEYIIFLALLYLYLCSNPSPSFHFFVYFLFPTPTLILLSSFPLQLSHLHLYIYPLPKKKYDVEYKPQNLILLNFQRHCDFSVVPSSLSLIFECNRYKQFFYCLIHISGSS